jgi:DNA-binding transcriptional MerR regulator
VLLLLLIQTLRKKGLSLGDVRKLLPKLELLLSDYFVSNGRQSAWLQSEAEVIAWLKRESRGAVLLYLPDFREKLGGKQ